MGYQRSLAYLAIGMLLCLFVFGDAPAQQKEPKPKPAPNEVIQTFPSNDVAKTAWKVQWATSSGHGLYIKEAWFKKAPQEPWMQVVGDVRLSEMFVPYNSGSPRFWDVSYNFGMVRMTAAEAGPFGKVLGNPPTVVQEIRDRGPMWMDGGSKPARRGQKLVLWGALSAANYRYLTEFSFCDDGTLSCRVGSSGHNYGSREFEGHMHNGLWRVDMNVAGPDNNTVQVMDHIEPVGGEDPASKAKAKTVHRLFNDGREGFEDFETLKFTMLSVINTKKKNARGQPYSYDIVCPRMGSARHHGGGNEDCTLHDFWVTRNRPNEMHYVNVPKYVAKAEEIVDTDVVVWLSTPGHHDPRSEDGEMVKGNLVGATSIMWTGFDLRPRNIWDRSPFYP